jgi:hypothetical protein
VLFSLNPGAAPVMPRREANHALADRRIELRPKSVGASVPHPRPRGPPESIAGRPRGRVTWNTTVAAAPGLTGRRPPLAPATEPARAGEDTAPASRLPPLDLAPAEIRR